MSVAWMKVCMTYVCNNILNINKHIKEKKVFLIGTGAPGGWLDTMFSIFLQVSQVWHDTMCSLLAQVVQGLTWYYVLNSVIGESGMTWYYVFLIGTGGPGLDLTLCSQYCYRWLRYDMILCAHYWHRWARCLHCTTYVQTSQGSTLMLCSRYWYRSARCWRDTMYSLLTQVGQVLIWH